MYGNFKCFFYKIPVHRNAFCCSYVKSMKIFRGIREPPRHNPPVLVCVCGGGGDNLYVLKGCSLEWLSKNILGMGGGGG